jgi:hypothetical protein
MQGEGVLECPRFKFVGISERNHFQQGRITYFDVDHEMTSSFEGTWVGGKKQGDGVQSDASGVFEGSFANNKRNGFGTLTKDGKEVYRGTWKDGKPLEPADSPFAVPAAPPPAAALTAEKIPDAITEAARPKSSHAELFGEDSPKETVVAPVVDPVGPRSFILHHPLIFVTCSACLLQK